MKLHIDIETFSSVDIMTAGVYKYVESIDFEILMVAYAFDDEETLILDLAQGDRLPYEFINALQDPSVEKHAHNANFERVCFRQVGYNIPINQWYCSAIKAAYCGLPFSLAMVSKTLKLEEKGKLATGNALIRFFSCPVKPTKINGKRMRNFPHHDPEKWDEYKLYCINDVEAEREIGNILQDYNIPEFERQNYILDQEINDRGILIDLDMAKHAYEINEQNAAVLKEKLIELTGLENPNSPAQLKKWLGKAIGKEIKSLAKDQIPILLKEAGPGLITDVLNLRSKASKTSIKKYVAMTKCACEDSRAHGLFQFYGANRTGRWASRLIQLQNLPRNYLKDIDLDRKVFASGDYDLVTMMYENISSTLSQLIRTAFIAKENHTFVVADFSAIEARVTAWLAGESWRMEVFHTHGKIYEASASMMFGIPIEDIKKGSDLRDKGKVAELALGYGGSLGALKKMGGEDMGLSEIEMENIVKKWRTNNPAIVGLWKSVEAFCKRAIKTRKRIVLSGYQNLIFEYDGRVLTIELPSGRKLFYQEPQIYKKTSKIKGRDWTRDAIRYKGVNQITRQWDYIDTYGGKLIENIVQAIARDLLADSMLRLNKDNFKIVMHVHDEAVAEVPEEEATEALKKMCDIMGTPIPWAEGLPLAADGYITPFYKKD